MNLKLIKWALTSSLLALAMPMVAQQETKDVKPNIVYSEQPEKYVLGGITVDQVQGFDQDILRNISGLTEGKMYDIPGADITAAIRKYWEQKLFSNVSVTADSIVGNKIYLHIHLAAQPRISAISYHGVKKSDRQKIEKQLGLQAGSQITPDMIDRAKLIIHRYYKDKGFNHASVEILQRDDATQPGKVFLSININRKNKIKVSNIYIDGVTPKEARKLKRAMKKTHEKSFVNFFRSKKFIPEKYEEDKQYLIDKMNAWGYRDALIQSDSVTNVDSAHVDVHIDLRKGQRYYLRNITWVGNTAYPTSLLDQVVGMKRGDVYNQEKLNKRLNTDDDAVGQLYYNNGYVFFNLQPTEINIEGDSIDLEMRVSEGRQAHFNRVIIKGNTRVYENVVRRELRTKPGDLFSMDAIKRSVMLINQLQQFDAEALGKALSSAIKPDPENGTVDITYPLETKGGDQLQLSVGWGPTGIVGQAGIKFTNFSIQNLFNRKMRRGGIIPQGDGQTLSLNVQTNGTYYQSYSFTFMDPWFGGRRPNNFSLSMYYNKQSDVNSRYYNRSLMQSRMMNSMNGYGSSGYYGGYQNYYDPDKYVKQVGLSVGFGKRLRWPDDLFTFQAQASYTRYMLKNWQYFLIQNGNSNNINMTLSLSRNSTDNAFFPRQGSEFLLSVQATPPFSLWNGIDYKNLALNRADANYQREAQKKYRWIEYNKWKFKLRTFTALTPNQKPLVLMTRTEFGILGSYSRYNKSPFETYYMGGDGMSGYSYGYATETIGLRGYENGSIAGEDGRNAYAYTRLSMELRYPLMLEGQTNMYALAFLEGGNAWDDVKDFNPFNLRRSAGIGVRISLPMIGMMGIDWAYGFQKVVNGRKVGGSQFHFIMNQEF